VALTDKPDGKIDATYDRMIVALRNRKWEGEPRNGFAFRGFDFTAVVFARWG
jgi:hypothetical protein